MGWGYGMINFRFKSYELLGNVGNDYFHFLSATPEDIPSFVYNFLMLIGIDALSLLISFVFLRMNFGINLFQVSLTTCITTKHFFSLMQVYCFQQREFGFALASQQSHILDMLFCTNTIGCAIDLSLKFNWLTPAYVVDDVDPRFSTNVNLSLLS